MPLFETQKVGHQDKRNRLAAVQSIQLRVDNHWEKLLVPTFGGGAIVDGKREVKCVKIFAPKDTALERLFQNDPELRGKIGIAIAETMRNAREDESQSDKYKSKLNILINDIDIVDGTDSVENLIFKPCRPIFDLKAVEMAKYFSQFIDSLYQFSGVEKPYQKWAVKKENYLYPATELPLYDQTAESILPRNEYFGPNKYFQGKNLLWRQKLVCAYLLAKVGFDYNTYAIDIPETYVPRTWKTEDFATYVDYTEEKLCKENMKTQFSFKNIISTSDTLFQKLSEEREFTKKSSGNSSSHSLPENKKVEIMKRDVHFKRTMPNKRMLLQDTIQEKVGIKKMKLSHARLPYQSLTSKVNDLEDKRDTHENICVVKERKSDGENSVVLGEKYDDDGEVPTCIQCFSEFPKNTPALICTNCNSRTHLQCVENYSNIESFICHRCTDGQTVDSQNDYITEDSILVNHGTKEIEAQEKLVFKNQLFNNVLEKDSLNLKYVKEEKNGMERSEMLQQKCDNLELFLKELNMSNFLPLFRKEKVDIDILKKMSHSDLQMFGIETFGDRYRIIDKLMQSSY